MFFWKLVILECWWKLLVFDELFPEYSGDVKMGKILLTWYCTKVKSGKRNYNYNHKAFSFDSKIWTNPTIKLDLVYRIVVHPLL